MTFRLGGRATVPLTLLTALVLVAFVACAGDPGSQGPAGAQGQPGAAGNPGASGNPGEPGSTGPAGEDGAQGTQGPTGAQGLAGQRGATGAQGAAGAEGDQGTAGESGVSAAVIVHDSAGNAAGVVELRSGTTSIDVLGGGFGAGDAITIELDGAALNAGAITANGGGAFAALGVSLPSGLSAGDVATVKVTGSGGTVGWGTLLVVDKE